jgi:hypothetical protein
MLCFVRVKRQMEEERGVYADGGDLIVHPREEDGMIEMQRRDG